MKLMMGTLAVAAATTIAGVAYAAEPVSLVDVQGPVLVNSGAGFKSVSQPLALRSGDRVLLSQGGVASVDYGAGCKVQLNVGVPATVQSSSPCVKSTAADLPVKAVAAPAAYTPPPADYGWVWVGALALGAGIGIGYWINDDGDRYYPVTGLDRAF